MTGMLGTIIPKSDQMNADDLIGGQTITIKITKVSIVMGDQPVAFSYEGDGGKPYKPGKSMRRVIVNAWGSDANLYVGRTLTLYRDDKVTFGGSAVGGIRISHMSDIKEPITMALTASKAVRKPFTVKPLAVQEPKPQPAPPAEDKTLALVKGNLEDAAAHGTEALQLTWSKLDKKYHKPLEQVKEQLKKVAKQADTEKEKADGVAE